MIYTVSRRTDIPGFYWPWFEDKLAKHSCMVRNPQFPEKISEYSLDPHDVDLFYFMSKNYEPAIFGQRYPVRNLIKKYRCLFEYTITPYGHDLEPNVPSPQENIQNLILLSGIVGKDRLLWAYDPVCITDRYTPEFHAQHFYFMAEIIAPYVSHARINFVNLYDKVLRNAPEIRCPTEQEADMLLRSFASSAATTGLTLKCCPTSPFRKYGFTPESCLSVKSMEDLFGVTTTKKNKNSCLMCSQKETARDLGLYETCGHGCRYCYATNNHKAALERIRAFDSSSPMLLDQPQGFETISKSRKSIIKETEKQTAAKPAGHQKEEDVCEEYSS